jgi:pseudomonalisin
MLSGHWARVCRLTCLTAFLTTALVAADAVFAAAAGAAPAGPVARIVTRIDDAQRSELKGHHTAIADSVDLGAADPALPAQRVVMLLGASDAQEADLKRFLHNVQTPGTAEYHHWLTPEAFGQRFGVAPADLATLRTWLQSKGFRPEQTPPARRSIVFSGTIGQLNDAFATRMHQYQWRGERHLANSVNPTIPQAFAGVVRGFASLHDFRLAPQFHRGALRGQANLSNGAHALAPGDFATIYNLTSTYAQGINGSGRTIAVIGRSDVQNADINTFRATFGLPAALPTVVLAGADPGLVANDQTESDLDLEWAGAVAPSAALKFVIAKSTSTTDGIVLSAQYAVNNNVADVITVSYGACEGAGDVSGGTTLFNQLWQQAAAQGTSVFVSSGDAGAAGCDSPSSTTATHGTGVNLVCSSPYSTCVGGTQFAADVSAPGSYWSSSNSSTLSSALQYIGEAVWNQSGTQSGGTGLWSSGGGTSIYYAKPDWQLSTGVPSDGRRDLPDVSLTASAAHDPYLIYSSDGNTGSTLEGIGGTSASAPAMAAIAALVAQKRNGRVGNLNPILYALSSQQAGGGSVVFHTITSGNNSVPGQAGFNASTSDPVYNQAAGLGSVDAGALLTHWSEGAISHAGLSPASVVVPAGASVGSATLVLPSTTTWSATIGGGASGWLTVTPTSGTGSAPLTYSARANSSSTARSGTITIDGQVLTVTQAAAAGAGSQLSLSTSTITFDTTMLGVTTAKTLLVSNTGGTSLTVGQISITGAAQLDFADAGTCSAGLVLSAGASCFLQVSFDPTALGSRSAVLQIGSASVALVGVGQPFAGDGPLPLWAYALLGLAFFAIAAARQRSAQGLT